MLDKEGLKMAAQFALGASLGRGCGPSGAEKRLLRFLRNKEEDMGEAKEALGGFPTMMAFLKTIAHFWGLDPFSRKVVAAYWLGCERLDEFVNRHQREALGYYLSQISGRSVSDLNFGEDVFFVPHHAWRVLWAGHVPPPIENANQCLVRGGRVVETTAAGRVWVEADRLDHDKSFVSVREKVALPSFLLGVPIGSFVAVHYGVVARVLTLEEHEQLGKWNRRIAIRC